MLLTIFIAFVTALLTGLVTFLIQERKLRADLKTEMMAETAVKRLLQSPKWKKRTFEEIKKRVAGFEDNELRKVLVRSGAVCFSGQGDRELWGLIKRNEDDL